MLFIMKTCVDIAPGGLDLLHLCLKSFFQGGDPYSKRLRSANVSPKKLSFLMLAAGSPVYGRYVQRV